MFMPSILEKSCLKYANDLIDKIVKLDINQTHLLFSGGIDSSFLITTYARKLKKTPYLLTIIYEKSCMNEQMNLTVSLVKEISSILNVKYKILLFSRKEFLEVLPEVIKVLKSYHPVETIDTAIIYLAIKKMLREENSASFITGDGGDELFYGYNYMIGMPPTELESHAKFIADNNIYPTLVIPKIHKAARIFAPFLNFDIKKLAFSIPHFVKINTYNERIYGKFFIRTWLARTLKNEHLAWLPKRPIREESGNPIDDVSDLITTKDAIKLMNKYNVILRSLQHAFLFKIYVNEGLDVPGIDSEKSNVCPHCGSKLQSFIKRCIVCGWWECIHGYPYGQGILPGNRTNGDANFT